MSSYPLLGPHVQSIFEYIKFEQENIHLGEFDFDILEFFGVPPNFNYVIDFFQTPIINTDNTPNPSAYGIVHTCDLVCVLNTIEVELVFTYKNSNLIVGPAIRVVSGDKDNATLYAALYNPRDHLLIFLRYLNQTVKKYGTKLGVVYNINLIDGDEVKLSGTGSNYSVYLNDILKIGPINDALIINTNKCVGVIEVALESAPVLKTIQDLFELIYLSRTFHYCTDGVSFNNKLLPVNDSENHFTNDLSVILKSGENGDKCYGFAYAQGFTNTDVALLNGRGYYIEFQFRYYNTPSGNPISGLAFLIDESKADPDDFTGWVVIINKKLGKIQLAYYLNESLNDLPDPSHIVMQLNKTIENDSLIKVIGSFSDDVLDTLWSIDIFTKQPDDPTFINDISYIGANQLSPGDQADVRKSRTNYGLAWMGNDSIGNHLAFWSGNSSQQYAIIN